MAVNNRDISDLPLGNPTIRIKIDYPLPDAEYESLERLLAAYQSHAYGKGYGVVLNAKKQNKEGQRTIHMCDKRGKAQNLPSQKNTGSRKTNCSFRIVAQEKAFGWRGYILEEHHNHEPSDDLIAHPSNRTKRLDINQEARVFVSKLLNRRTRVSTIRSQVQNKWGVELNARDEYNFGQKIRSQELGGKTPINWLADELEERNFFHRIDTDENNRVTRLFSTHPDCVKLMKEHPDIILLDCTYQTNRFSMPMVNICGSSGGNKTPQLAIGFLSGEKKDDYVWIMNCFNELLKENEIPSSKCFVTDRELALLNTLVELFPSSDHILCRWHVNMNVVAKTKRLFSDQETFNRFYDAWNAVIDCESFEIYNSNVSNLQKHKLSAVKYVENTWLIWREKVVSCWVNKAAHFGNTATSRNESSHAAIKAYLHTSTGDHKQIFGAICLFWEDQHRDIRQDIAQHKIKPRHAVKIQLFQDDIGFIHPFALQKILEEKGKLPRKLTDALPQACRRREQTQLERRTLLEPSIVKGKGRPKGSKNKVRQKAKGYGVTSTRRDPSLHEYDMIKPYLNPVISCVIIEDEELSQVPATAKTDASKRDTTESYSKLSTTALGITRGAGGARDLYEAGTRIGGRVRQRGVS
ncbi:hypothetical protein K3495_g9420 [Podosphaera aphanis]|nr:hypothetical protein K3495_g9420 [Podosphaera aphanis]